MKNYTFVLLAIVGCQTKNENTGSSDQLSPLIGEWRNISLNVEIDKKNGEPTSVFEIDENTWEEQLQIRPIRTYFRNDKSFNSEHYNLKDSLVLNPSGTWTDYEDEITMITTKPFSDTTSCTYKVKDNVVTFGCWVDWDEDGERDDWYVGTQRKY